MDRSQFGLQPIGMQSYSGSEAGSLQGDNEGLRHKLHELREDNGRLVSYNHAIQSELEKARYELHRAVTELSECKNNQQELVAEVVRLRSSVDAVRSERNESNRDVEVMRARLTEANNLTDDLRYRLNEAGALIDMHNATVKSVQGELAQLRQCMKRTEAERDLALESAEKIQSSFEEFRTRVRDKLNSAESQLSDFCSQRTNLLQDLADKASKLEAAQKHVDAVESSQTDVRRHNVELRGQVNRLTQRVNGLETDLVALEATRRDLAAARKEVGELTREAERRKVKQARCQMELKDAQHQLSRLESIANIVQQQRCSSEENKHSSKLRKRNGFDSVEGDVAPEARSSTDYGSVSSDAILDLKRKLKEKEVELLNVKESLAKCSVRENTDRNICDHCTEDGRSSGKKSTNSDYRHLDIVSEKDLCNRKDKYGLDELLCDGALEVEASLARLEEEKERLESLVASLERTVSELRVEKASMDAMMSQRTTQIASLQSEAEQRGAREGGLEREMRKKAVQCAGLERQLRESLLEAERQSTRVRELETETESLSAELTRVKTEFDVKSRELVELSSVTTRLKQLHAEHCRETDAQAAMLERRVAEASSRVDQSEGRAVALLKNLDQSNERCRSLEAELSDIRSNRDKVKAELGDRSHAHDVIVRELGSKLGQVDTMLKFTEEELSECRSVAETREAELSSRAEKIRLLEERVSAMVRESAERSAELEELGKCAEHKQTMLQESGTRIKELEGEHVKLEGEIERLEKEREKERERVEECERKLAEACVDLERREEQVKTLGETLRAQQTEKKKHVDELINQIQTYSKQLKTEKQESEDMSTRLTAEITKLTSVIEGKDAALKEYESRLQDSATRLEDETRRANERAVDLERTSQAFVDTERILQETRHDLTCTGQDNDALKQTVEKLREEVAGKQSEVEGLHETLEASRRDMERCSGQVKQLDGVLRERCAEAEQRFQRLDGVLKATQLESDHRGRRVVDLEEHVQNLLGSVKDKSQQMLRLEEINAALKAELDKVTCSAGEMERRVNMARQETQVVSKASEQAMDQLKVSREHLQRLQSELSDARREVTSTQVENDRLARDLADAAELVQAKDSELSRLMQSLTELTEARAYLDARIKKAEKDRLTTKDQHCVELTSLKDCHETVLAAREQESALLQKHLEAAEDRQRQLVAELRRATRRLGAMEAEQDAAHDVMERMHSRLASESSSETNDRAERSTLMQSLGHTGVTGSEHMIGGHVVNPADVEKKRGREEVVRPRQRVDSEDGMSGRESQCSADSISTEMLLGSNALLCEAALNKAVVSHGRNEKHVAGQTAGQALVDIGNQRPNRTKLMSKKLGDVDKKSETGSTTGHQWPDDDDNLDRNLDAMWNKLQQMDFALPAGGLKRSNSSSSLRSNSICSSTSTGVADPKRMQSSVRRTVAPSGAVEEKQRVQDRLKALIGYKEPRERKAKSELATVAFRRTKSEVRGSRSSVCKTGQAAVHNS